MLGDIPFCSAFPLLFLLNFTFRLIFQERNLRHEKMLPRLAMKNAVINDLKERLEDLESVEEENKQLLESLEFTSEVLLNYEKDLQEIRTAAGQEVSKLKRENSLLQKSRENDLKLITRLKKTERKYVALSKYDQKLVNISKEVSNLKKEMSLLMESREQDQLSIVKFKEAEEKFKGEKVKIKEEMMTKQNEMEKMFAEEITKTKEEKNEEMVIKIKETEKKFSEENNQAIIAMQKEMEEMFAEEMAKIKEEKDQEMTRKLKEMEKKFVEELSKEKNQEIIMKEKETSQIKEYKIQEMITTLKEENNQLKGKVKRTEKEVLLLEPKKKRRESQEESNVGDSESDVSVVFEKIKQRKKVVGVFTHQYIVNK